MFDRLELVRVGAGGDADGQGVGVVVAVHARGPHHGEDEPGAAQAVRERPVVTCANE